MLPRRQVWSCLLRPFYKVPKTKNSVGIITQFMPPGQKYRPISSANKFNNLFWEISQNRFHQYSGRSKTQICKCSTVGHSEIDDGLKTDTEEENVGAQESVSKVELSEGPERMEAARLEIDVMRSAGSLVPDSINDADLEYFISLNTKKSRKRFLSFLYKKEKIRLKEKEKRRVLREERELVSPKKEDDFDGPMKNRLFLQLQPRSILQFDNWRLAAGMKFGSKIVFDFSYEEHMRRPEIISLVKQLMITLGANKLAKDPFDIHWTGLADGSATMREMQRMYKEHLDTTMVNITDGQVQDIFPAQDIVYLTADSPNILRFYDPTKVYVVGALVDSHKILSGLSFAKAKRHDLNHAHLPLDLFLKWNMGGKNLTLDQMMQILIELNTSGDWIKALSHVPTRKHIGLKLEQSPDQLKNRDGKTAKASSGQEKRFSSSRAKHSRSWPVLSETPFQRSKTSNSSSMRRRAQHILDGDDEEDPVNETMFSPSGGLQFKKKYTKGTNKDRRWFED